MSILNRIRRCADRRPLLQRCPVRSCQAYVYDVQAHYDREHGELPQ